MCFSYFLHYTILVFLISRVMYCFKADIIIGVASYKYVHNYMYITFAPFNSNLYSILYKCVYIYIYIYKNILGLYHIRYVRCQLGCGCGLLATCIIIVLMVGMPTCRN